MASKGWSDAEKVALLFSIIESTGSPVKWSTVEIPPGRTVKACMNMLARLKELSKTVGDSGEPSTPVKKRKGGVETDEPDEAAIPSPAKRKKTPKKNVKVETEEETGELEVKQEGDV